MILITCIFQCVVVVLCISGKTHQLLPDPELSARIVPRGLEARPVSQLGVNSRIFISLQVLLMEMNKNLLQYLIALLGLKR